MIYLSESPPLGLEKDTLYSQVFQVKGYEKDIAIIQKVVVITVGQLYHSDEMTAPKIRHYQNVNGTCQCNQANDL